MMSVVYVLAAIVMLGLIVAVHEFGHYLAGRLTGMGILEYAIGMGPKIFGFEKGGIKYSLRAIPLGGYCSFLGEDEAMDDPRAMRNQKVWKRFVTVAAGPLMNFVLAFVVIVAYYCAYGAYQSAPLVADVVAGSVAETAGFAAGDVITAVGDVQISMDASGQSLLIENIRSADDSAPVVFEVDRNGEKMQISLVPEWSEEAGAYQIGVMLGGTIVRLGLIDGIRLGGVALVEMSTMMIDGLRQLFGNKEMLEQTMGPVGIISTVSRDVSQGMDMVMNWIVIISLNLGIMNLLPVPGLDGGRLLFLTYEGIFRKPIPTDKEAIVHLIGLLLVLAFLVFITFKDVANIFTGG